MATIVRTTVRTQNNPGIRYVGPASYATNGDSFTAQESGIGVIEQVIFGVAVNAAGAAPRLLVYDYTNSKVRWFVPNTGDEVAAATDLSGYTVRTQVLGK